MMGHVTTGDYHPLYIISSISIRLELSLGSGTYMLRFLFKDVAQ